MSKFRWIDVGRNEHGSVMGMFLDEMEDGDEGYVTPWTVGISFMGELFIRPDAFIHKSAEGTVELKVVKGSGVYFIDVPPNKDYSFDGSVGLNCLPVYIYGSVDAEIIQLNRDLSRLNNRLVLLLKNRREAR